MGNLFLSLDPSNPLATIMPGKRKAATKRAAQREWMIEQKTKSAKTEDLETEEEETAEKTTEEDNKDSDNDSGVEDSTEEAPEPSKEVVDYESMSRKDLNQECKKLDIPAKGSKADLIEKIKAALSKPVEEEPAAEEVAVEEEEVAVEEEEVAVEEEEAPVSEEAPAAEESPAAAEVDEEDAPLEDWTKKELMEECIALGLSDKGNKAVLIERIKEAKPAAVVEETPEAPAAEEEPAAEEVAVAEEEAPVAEETPAVEEAPAA